MPEMTEAVELPEPPATARSVFAGDAWPRIDRYARLLAGPAVLRGLIGPREVDRIWDRHLLNCAVIAEAIRPNASVVDIGSGAGLPGIVLAIARPDLSITLLEPLLRRTAFLDECVEVLQLDGVDVVRGRAGMEATDMPGRHAFDVAVARAVAPLDRLAELALPLLKPGGELLAIKGERAALEMEQARPRLSKAGVQSVELVHVGRGKVDPPATLVRVVAGSTRGRKR